MADTQNIMSTYEGDITSITTANASGKVYLPANANYIFKAPEMTTAYQTDISNNNYTNLESATIPTTSKLTSMDLSNLDASNTKSMVGMFSLQQTVKSITGISNLVTSTTTTAANMFYMDYALTALDVSNWDTSNITNFSKTFSLDTSLTSLDVSKWNVSKATSMDCMFQNVSSLTSLDVSKWNTQSLIWASWTFGGMTSLKSLDVSNWNMLNVVTMRKMFFNTNLTTLDISKWQTPVNQTLDSTFSNMSKLTTLDASNFNTSDVTNFTSTFANDSSLQTLDVSNWNLSNAISLHFTFSNDTALTALDVSKWNVSSVKDFYGLFENTLALKELAVANWTLNPTNWTNIGRMFQGSGISSLDLSNWNVSKISTFAWTFDGLPNLVSLNLSNWNIATNDFRWAFAENPKLTTLNLSNWTIKPTDIQTSMLQDDPNLSALILGNNVKLTSDSGLLDIQWINSSDISKYYANALALESYLLATTNSGGTYVPYKAPAMSDIGNHLDFKLTAGNDAKTVSLDSSTKLATFGYIPNDSYNPSIDVKLSTLQNSSHQYAFNLSNMWSNSLLPATLNNQLTIATTNTTRNKNLQSLNYSQLLTADLSSLKYGYAGTYQATIQYKVSDGH